MSEIEGGVEAELFYRKPLRVGEVKPSFGREEPDLDRPDHEGFSMQIRDARDKDTSLEREGFLLVNHTTKIKDFYDARDIQESYYPEIKALVQEHSGAAFVQIISHITRSEERAAVGSGLGAHRLVHNDFTPNLKKAIEPLVGGYDIDKGRVCVFNLWRRFDLDMVDAPLAVCDALSVDEEKLIPTDLHNYGGGEGFQVEIYQSSHCSEHRWFYFPKMQRDEVLVFKTFDSVMDPFLPTLHSAFDAPDCSQEATPRESVEVRAMCFYA